MKQKDLDTAKSLVEGFNVGDWMNAEEEARKSSLQPQPKGSVTAKQYRELTGRSAAHAQRMLGDLVNSGLATRERWINGNSGAIMVYFLNTRSKH